MKKSGFLFLSLFVLFFSACTTDVPNDPSATETSSDIVEDQTFDKTININFTLYKLFECELFQEH